MDSGAGPAAMKYGVTWHKSLVVRLQFPFLASPSESDHRVSTYGFSEFFQQCGRSVIDFCLLRDYDVVVLVDNSTRMLRKG